MSGISCLLLLFLFDDIVLMPDLTYVLDGSANTIKCHSGCIFIHFYG